MLNVWWFLGKIYELCFSLGDVIDTSLKQAKQSKAKVCGLDSVKVTILIQKYTAVTNSGQESCLRNSLILII